MTENDKGLKPTRISELAVLAAVAAVATWILIRVFYGSMPPIPVYAGASLYFVAVAEAVFAFVIRSRVKTGRSATGSDSFIRSPPPERWHWPKHPLWSVQLPSVSGSECWCISSHSARFCRLQPPTRRARGWGWAPQLRW